MKVNSRTLSCTSKNLNFYLKSISGRFPSRISRQADSDGTPKLKFRHRDIVPAKIMKQGMIIGNVLITKCAPKKKRVPQQLSQSLENRLLGSRRTEVNFKPHKGRNKDLKVLYHPCENLRSKRKSLRHSNRMHKNNNGFHVSPTCTVHSELSKSLNTVQTKAKFESDSQKEPHSLGSPHHSIHNRSVNWGTSTGKQWFNVSQREPQKHIQSFIQETTGRNNVTYDQAASLQSTRYLQELSDGHFQHQHGKISLKTKTTPFCVEPLHPLPDLSYFLGHDSLEGINQSPNPHLEPSPEKPNLKKKRLINKRNEMIQKNKAVFGVKGKMLKIHNKVEDIVSNKYDVGLHPLLSL
ncbi:unnamed protein product [Moneuplotes crassus]|uniref:Uncharacterized protein n=1 Tax=Euplotes crassus TaxID=5936 RepID=A0AAD1Y258_EUPCR|nr:unnamed protein product [Moneuplotes crassus]